MFTGIIECVGEVIAIEESGSNINYIINSSISNELKIDQSVAHDGVCLTVTKVGDNDHYVTAIDETLSKTTLRDWKVGTKVNLERCMSSNGRFDGHMVYGHVDTVGKCIERVEKEGSVEFVVQFNTNFAALIVEKGSITLNGTSLTIFDVKSDQFKIAIIPYTLHHTTIQYVNEGDDVNLEFDILGKYVQRLQSLTSA